MTQSRAVSGRHPLERVGRVFDAAVQDELAGLVVEDLEGARARDVGGRAGRQLHLRAGPVVPAHGDVGALRRPDGQETAHTRRRDVVQRPVPVPLVEPAEALLALLLGDMGRQMEFVVVDALDLEARRELVVVLRHLSPAEDVHLRLHGDGGSRWDAIDVDVLVRCEEGIGAVRKSSRRLVGVEVRGQEVLLLWPQHFGLLLEDQHLVFVQRVGNEFEIRVGQFVQVDAVDFGAEVDFAVYWVLERHDSSVGALGMREGDV